MKGIMEDEIKILAGPFETRDAAFDALETVEDEIDSADPKSLEHPRAAKGLDGKWYVIDRVIDEHVAVGKP